MLRRRPAARSGSAGVTSHVRRQADLLEARSGSRAVAAGPGPVRLVDGMHLVEPTWVEAVSIVKAVCVQLAWRQMPPAIGDVVVTSSGRVSFPPGGIADEDVSIQAMARLLGQLLGRGLCPLQVWTAIDRATEAPMLFRTVHGFGDFLSCLPSVEIEGCLAAYVARVRAMPAGPAPPSHRAARRWRRFFR